MIVLLFRDCVMCLPGYRVARCTVSAVRQAVSKARQGKGEAMESLGTYWVCTCCMLTQANGECCDSPEHGGDGCEPLSAIRKGDDIALGMTYEEHDDDCLMNTMGGNCPSDYECDCETRSFSRSQCEGCESFLRGSRHAMTVFRQR